MVARRGARCLNQQGSSLPSASPFPTHRHMRLRALTYTSQHNTAHKHTLSEISFMSTTAPRLQFYGLKNFDQLPQLALVSPEHRAAMKVVAHVLPFRVNNYVINELINWNNVPDDPIFQL